jgi:hypothetical protein
MKNVSELFYTFKADREKVVKNDLLTDKGKRAAWDKLQKTHLPIIRANVQELRNIAIASALNYQMAQRLAETERKAAAKDVDYSRLMYTAMVAQNQVKGANLFEVQEAWERVKESGDDYMIRAWREVVPGEIRATEYPDATDEKPGLLQDIAASETEAERIITDMERAALADLHQVLVDAQELDKAKGLITTQTGDGDGGIERRIMQGINLYADQAEIDFEARLITENKFGKEQTRREEPEEVIERLENGYKAQAEYLNEKTNSDYDPDFEDLSGGVIPEETGETEAES